MTEQKKIPIGGAVAIIVVAFIFDSINIGLDFVTFGILGWLVDLGAVVILSPWLAYYGINIWSGARIFGTLIAFAIDAVPFGDLVFPWTIRVAFAVVSARLSSEIKSA